MSEPVIYTRLPLLRVERGLSRRDLAQVAGCHYQTIGYIERGEYMPSLEIALRLANHFKLPVEAVFSLTPFPPLGAEALATSKAHASSSLSDHGAPTKAQ